jgi:hypothetical protein
MTRCMLFRMMSTGFQFSYFQIDFKENRPVTIRSGQQKCFLLTSMFIFRSSE